MPDGWDAAAGGFPAITRSVSFLMKDVVLLGVSLYLLKQDVARLAAQSTHACGFAPDGLPIGLQIVGRPFDEETVLKACHAFESATDYHLRRPQLPGLGD